MGAPELKQTLHLIQGNMAQLAPYRKPALFTQFLVQGYTAITLSSVPRAHFSDLLRAKLCLGAFITLCDDFADRPTQHDPDAVEALAHMRFGQRSARAHKVQHKAALDFAKMLFDEMGGLLTGLPHYKFLMDFLNFDLSQIHTANRYASLVTGHPYAGNALENRNYAHHNMGMTLASMMDLVALAELNCTELGSIREVFFLGQRFGRICNVLATRRREQEDGDVTGELATCQTSFDLAVGEARLHREMETLRDHIRGLERSISSFSVAQYLEGLNEVQRIHNEMEGTI